MNYVQLITIAISLVESILTMIGQWQTAAAASNAITPEQSAAFDAQINTLLTSQAWQTDAQVSDTVPAATVMATLTQAPPDGECPSCD